MSIQETATKIKRNWISKLPETPPIEDYFLSQKKITEDQYVECKSIALERQCNIANVLIEKGYSSENAILNFYAEFLEVDYIANLTRKNLEDLDYDTSFLNRFNPKQLDSKGYMPVKFESAEFSGIVQMFKATIIISDPWQMPDIESEISNVIKISLRERTKLKDKEQYKNTQLLIDDPTIEIEIYLAKIGEIRRVLQEVAGGDVADKYAINTKEEQEARSQVNKILNTAIKHKASDIQITTMNRQRGIKVRFREDGDMVTIDRILNYSARDYGTLLNKIMGMSGMEYTRKEIPQSGAFRHFFEQNPYDIRVQVMPTIMNSADLDGSCIQMRILYKQSAVTLDNCGLYPDQMSLIRDMYKQPWGMLLTTGPTGSGKTTTIYSILQELDLEKKCCYTIEDPVEYVLEDTVQTPVSEARGRSFADLIKSLMRSDPDILYLGEIRDNTSAEAAIQIANTGHTVFSTLHTNSSYNVPQRLQSMGIPSHALGSSLSGVIAQRLAKKICPHCKERYEPPREVLNRLELPLNGEYWHGSGKNKTGDECPFCKGKGFKGRIGIFEVLPLFKHPGWESLLHDPSKLKYEMVTSFGYLDLYSDAVRKIRDGLISPDSIDGLISPNDVVASTFIKN